MSARPDLLRAGAAWVREYGLNKHYYVAKDGRVCTVGSLIVASGWMETVHSLEPEITLLSQLLGGPGDINACFKRVTQWNDEDKRTAEDVITLLEQAAEKLEAEL